MTLRTSIIGHELASAHGLVDWFLAQKGSVRGFTRAVFSGLPTVELARVIRDSCSAAARIAWRLSRSAEPISKYDLLRLVGADLWQVDRDRAMRRAGDRSLARFDTVSQRDRLSCRRPGRNWASDARFRLTSPEPSAIMFKDKTLLITGGTGSFGNAVVKHSSHSDFAEIRIFSRDEKKQEDMRLALQERQG